ncbi:MAG: hypothetical protein ACI91B_003217 [Planctomycetota bacterium]|jgi:hypothetical protein
MRSLIWVCVRAVPSKAVVDHSSRIIWALVAVAAARFGTTGGRPALAIPSPRSSCCPFALRGLLPPTLSAGIATRHFPNDLMTAPLSRCLLLAALGAATLAFSGSAQAQVPKNHAVVGTFSGPNAVGCSGLFTVSLANGAVTAITGLPPALKQPGGINSPQGVSSVVIRPSDGALIVGSVATGNVATAAPVYIYVLHLNAAAVVSTQQIWIGSTVTSGDARVLMMPDERVLVSASNGTGVFTIGPMAGHRAAIWDLSVSPPTYSLLPNTGGNASGGGFAVDATGQFVYNLLTAGAGTPTPTASLYRWDMTNLACVVASWPGHFARGLVCDDDGAVYVTMNDAVSLQQSVATVYPNACNPVSSTSVMSVPPSPLLPPVPAHGVALDRASGSFVVAAAGWYPGFPNTFFNTVSLVDPAGATNVLTHGPIGGWCTMGGLAVNNAMESYGAPTNGANSYWFDNFPNPTGQPVLGSTFSITMRSAPGTAIMSLLGLSLGTASIPILGINLLLDPSTLLLMDLPTPPTSPMSYSMLIPATPALIGFVFHAQSLHIEANLATAASRGLTVKL